MKSLSKNLKYIILGVVLLVAGFSFTNLAQADTYYNNCSSGGSVATEVYLSSNTIASSTGFTAYGKVTTSNCPLNSVTVTANNNNNGSVTMIGPSSMGGNAVLPSNNIPVQQPFTSPSSPASYVVHFSTTISEPVSFVQNYSNAVTSPYGGGAITGVCTLGTPYGGDPGWIGTRDVQTQQSADSRGVNYVVVTYMIGTDNYPSPCNRYPYAVFYPGNTQGGFYWNDGANPEDFTCGSQTNYCSASNVNSVYSIQEY